MNSHKNPRDFVYEDHERSFITHKSTANFNPQKRTLSTSKSTTHQIHSNFDTDHTLSFTQNTMEPNLASFIKRKDLSLTNSIKKEDYNSILYRKQRESHTFKHAKSKNTKDLVKVYAPESVKYHMNSNNKNVYSSQGFQAKKRSQSKLAQYICKEILSESNDLIDVKQINYAPYSHINCTSTAQMLNASDYRSKPMDLSLKTAASSHIVPDSTKRKDEFKMMISKIEGEMSCIKLISHPDDQLSTMKRLLDDFSKAEPMLSSIINEIKKGYDFIITSKTDKLDRDLEIITKSKVHSEDIAKELEVHNSELLKEIKTSQKYIDNQKAIIKELKVHSSQLQNKEINILKASIDKYKEDNKKLGKIIVRFQSENNQLKDKNRSLMQLLKSTGSSSKSPTKQQPKPLNSIKDLSNQGISKDLQKELRRDSPLKLNAKDIQKEISKNQNEEESSNEKLSEESKGQQQVEKFKVPALDFSKIMKKSDPCRLVVKKSFIEHHSSSSSSPQSSNEEVQKPKIPKLDLSILGGKQDYHSEFLGQAKEFSKSWRDQLALEQLHAQ